MSNWMLTTCGLLAVLAAPAWAVDRQVPGAFPTIGAAVAAAQPGDRIIVGPGIYQENVVANVANLQFIGKRAIWDGTLVNGLAGVCLTATGDGTVVQGFIFRAGEEGVAQVQLTGTGCRVSKCSSRGPGARFLKITGHSAVVDACSLFAVDSTAIEIVGDGAMVKKVRARQCEDDVIRIEGNAATVTGCNMALNDDGDDISITGHGALVFLNVFVDCDSNISITGTNATVMKNKSVSNGGGTFLSVNGDNAIVERNQAVSAGGMSVTGDNITVRGNTVTSAPDDRNGISASSRTAAGGGRIELNKVKDVAQTGLFIGCHNAIVLGNRVTGAGTENNESACRVSGNGNRLTNNVVLGGGTHGFDVSGASNTLVKCTVIDAAADGFHINGNGNTLLICDAMLCTGEGLDNGGTGTTVIDCAFKNNRLDVANDGTFVNSVTFIADNTFTTGGPGQSPQVD